MNTRGVLPLFIMGSMLLTVALAKPLQTTTFDVTNTNDSGPGSLREAIDLANASPGADSILFEISGTIYLTSTLPTIAEDLSIDGSGQDITIDGQISEERILEVPTGVSLQLVELSLINGHSEAEGGAILSAGSLDIQGCFFEGSIALTGGAIYSSGALTIGGGTILSVNDADTGGGIYSSGDLYIEDTSFIGNEAISFEGGGIYATGPSARLVNVTFTGNNWAVNEGGAIYRLGNMSITDAEFSDNHSWSGTVFHSGGELVLHNTRFTNNSADSNGGAVLSNGAVVISGGYFSGNCAVSGGAIYLLAGSLATIQNTTFEDSTASASGGAMYLEAGCKENIQDVTIEDNTAGTGGGIYLETDCTGIVQGVVFDKNRAEGDGGAIWNSGTLDLESVQVIDNQAMSNGGGIMNLGHLEMRESTLSNNTSKRAGAISNSVDVRLYITDSVLDHNQAEYAGAVDNNGALSVINSTFESNEGDEGGALINNGNVSLIQVTFSGNQAYDGGALINWGEVDIQDGVFLSNRAYGDWGGAIINGGGLRIHNTTFTGNNVKINGGVISNSGPLEITGGLFSSNGAKWGGAIYHRLYNNQAVIRGVTFQHNGAGHWGAAILNDGNMLVEDCVFNANFAAEYSGGIHNGGELTVRNSTLSNNISGRTGGGMENWGHVTIENTTISGNQAYIEGAALQNKGTALLDYITMSGNTILGVDGVGAINNSGTLEIGHSIVAGTQGSSNCSGVPVQNSPNLSDDDSCPGFTVAAPLLGPLQDNGGLSFTHALLPGSPAVDAASDPDCPSTDQRSEPRPQGLDCDLGAFEAYQVMVTIDIQPKSSKNIINLNSTGTIPVAVLSTPGFDAPGQIEPSSLTFGARGWEVSPVILPSSGKLLCSGWDVNGDHLLDLICTFPIPGTSFTCESDRGILRGFLHNGAWISGMDLVTPRPCS